MPTENQDLIINVKLNENVSRELANLRQHIQAYSQASQTFDRMGATLQVGAANMRAVAGAATTAAAAIRLLAGPVALIFGGIALRRQFIQLRDWSNDLRQTANNMREAGISYGDFRNVANQMRMIGVSAQQTQEILRGVASSIAQLNRPGSEIWQTLMLGARGGNEAGMANFINQYRQSKTMIEALDRVRIAGENIYRNELKRTNNEWVARNTEMEFFRDMNIDPALALHARRFSEASREQKELWERMEKNSATFSADVDKLMDSFELIGDIIKSDIIESGLAANIERAAKILDWISSLRLRGEKFQTDIGVPPMKTAWGAYSWATSIGTSLGIDIGRWLGLTGKNDEVLQENTKRVKELNDRIENWIQKNVHVPHFAKGGVVHKGPVRALVGEAGREAIINKRGTKIVDKPTIATLGRDGSEAVVPLDGAAGAAASAGVKGQIPNAFANDVSALIKAGHGTEDIHEWLKTRGVDVSIPTCAQFMSVVVAEHGGTLPYNPESGALGYRTASNWNLFGKLGYDPDPNAINVAVKQGVPIGRGDSHVTVPIPQYDKDGNIVSWIGRGVNQKADGSQRGIISDTPIIIGDKAGQYHIRSMVPDLTHHDAAWAGMPAMQQGGIVQQMPDYGTGAKSDPRLPIQLGIGAALGGVPYFGPNITESMKQHVEEIGQSAKTAISSDASLVERGVAAGSAAFQLLPSQIIGAGIGSVISGGAREFGIPEAHAETLGNIAQVYGPGGVAHHARNLVTERGLKFLERSERAAKLEHAAEPERQTPPPGNAPQIHYGASAADVRAERAHGTGRVKVNVPASAGNESNTLFAPMPIERQTQMQPASSM